MRRPIAWLLATTSLALTGALFLLACDGGGPAPPEATLTTTAQESDVTFVGGSLLFTSNRTHLSLCVDGAGGSSISAAEVQVVRQALEDALAAFPDVPPQYLEDVAVAAPDVPPEYSEREVSSGCPAPQRLTATPMNVYDRNSLTGGDVIVGRPGGPDEPSEHRVFVYFVASGAYAASFGSEAYATTVEEFVCGGDVCEGVTRGLYVPESVSSDALREGLLRALNLLFLPSTEREMDWEACERGEQPHPDFDCERYDDWKREQEQSQ